MASFRFAGVVRADAAGDQPQTLERPQAIATGIRERPVEPAIGARAHAGEKLTAEGGLPDNVGPSRRLEMLDQPA